MNSFLLQNEKPEQKISLSTLPETHVFRYNNKKDSLLPPKKPIEKKKDKTKISPFIQQSNLNIEEEISVLTSTPITDFPTEDSPDQEWDVTTYVGIERILTPLSFSLVEEIVESSVICCSCFSPDGKYLAIGSNLIVRIYEINSGEGGTILKFDPSSPEFQDVNHARSIQWFHDSERLIVGYDDGIARVFNSNGSLLYKITDSTGQISKVLFSPNEAYFIISDSTGSLFQYNADTFELIKKKEHDAPIYGTSISYDSNLIIIGLTNGYIYVYNSSFHLLYRSHCHDSIIYSITFLLHFPSSIFSAQTDKIPIATGDGTGIIKLWLWDKENKKLELFKTIPSHQSSVLDLTIDNTGKYLISGSKDMLAGFTSLETGITIYSIAASVNSVTTICFSPNGDLFSLGSGDQTLKIFTYGYIDS